MISIYRSLKLGLKKIKFSKGKTLFVIIPISLMFAIIVIASSEAVNLINVAHASIFSSIQSQNEVIELNQNGNSGNGLKQISFSSSSSDEGYTNADIATISSINNVEKSSLVSQLPIKNIKTTDLFTDKTVSFSDVAGLDSEYAKLYTDASFNYTEGQVIPIILNANDFKETYQDWQGKTEIDVDFSKLRGSFTPGQATQGDPIASQSPSKTRAISYDKNTLIGKEFTIQVGGLDDIQTFKQTATSTGFTFTQKTQDEINTEISTRKDSVSKYWNYDQISKPLTYTFKVVGIAEGADKTKTYIPSAFAQKLMQDYLTNELTARNSTDMPSTDQNSTYKGLVYDGVTLKDDSVSSLFAGIRRQVSGQVNEFNNRTFTKGERPVASVSVDPNASSTGDDIPGLVFQKDRTTEAITGEYKSFDFSNALPLDSTTILIKVNNVNNREQVVTDLNSKGYNYQDFSKYKEFNKLESYLYTILNIASIIFMVVTALFILINMAKFVSESRKEIGIFRAIGASKNDIRKIFVLQSLSYIILSIILGFIIGGTGLVLLSGTMLTSAQSFINTTVGGIINLSSNVSRQDFLGLDLKTIGIYTGVLLVVSLIVSLIPSEQAAKVSPVEAIRS